LNTLAEATPNHQQGEMDLSDSKTVPNDFLSTLRPPTTRRRKRQWEQQFKAKTYRGVSPQAHAAVKQAAADQGCSIDQAATIFLQYGLLCYRRGDKDLCLKPVFRHGRYTLFPDGETDSDAPQQRVGWKEKIWDLQPPRRKERPGRSPSGPVIVKPWKDWPWVGYRLPGGVVNAIDALRIEKMVPTGEVVTRLLEHSSWAYQTGRLILTPEITDPDGC
jgi:hypothetical protein